MELLEKVLKTIQTDGLLNRGETVVLGISGGADSMAMLYLLNELQIHFQYRIVVAHLNHGLRGEESDRDMLFVEEHARSLNLPFISERRDVRALAQSKSLCLEDAAREARYDFFRKVSKTFKAEKVAVAHTQDDQAETFFLRILRGAGTSGLGAMKLSRPFWGGVLIRPLLQVSRKELLEYLQVLSISWREDSSNQDLYFARNKVRNLVFPLLKKEFNPALIGTLCRTSDILSVEGGFLNQETEKVFQELIREEENGLTVSIRLIKELPQALRRRLVRMMYSSIVGRDGLSFSQLENIESFLGEAQSGRRLELPRGIELWREYEKLVMAPCLSQTSGLEEVIKIPGEAVFEWGSLEYGITAKRYLKEKELVFDKVKNNFLDYKRLWFEGKALVMSECFDANQLGDSFVVRARRPGDRYDPIGLGFSKKVKDIFVDEKVPVRFRAFIPFFADREKIFWIGGYRISESFKVTEETKTILEIRLTIGGKENV